ncbi:MAG: TIGR04540 family protein [Terrisporobacter sp.]|uniref:TIGR04540 family protein n=1 Tax=Terrisporobacter sp. TaxID=1965305 RepID=UPI002FCC1618
MSKNNVRLFYKNQTELGQALKNYVDEYFNDKINQEDFESNIILIINSNKDKFFKNLDIAKKTKQILGKKRLEVLEKVIENRSDFYEKNSCIK